MKILLTGAAGFIGMAVTQALLKQGHQVVGIDNLNDYYSVQLKKDRIQQITLLQEQLNAQNPGYSSFQFQLLDITQQEAIEKLFTAEKFDWVVHLAAQAGVRYSLDNPHAYAQSNLVGFLNILEGCRHHSIQHLVYASSSSVYGGNAKTPFAETDAVDHPVSFYAATKKANELMAHTYSHLYDLPSTGLRFFTVYGPWGRPDMAPFLFTQAILEGRPIQVFNYGQMSRDFTYIDDIVQGVIATLNKPPSLAQPETAIQGTKPARAAPFHIFNIGHHQPVPLIEFIETLENCLGIKAQKLMLPMQQGDVPTTYADTQALEKWVDFKPNIELKDGLARFVEWYMNYYQQSKSKLITNS